MKTLGIMLVLTITAFFCGSTSAIGSDCTQEKIPQALIQEYDRTMVRIIHKWLARAPMESVVEDIGFLVSRELYLRTACVEDPGALEDILLAPVPKGRSGVECVPARILEHLVGDPVLSVNRQFKVGGADEAQAREEETDAADF